MDGRVTGHLEDLGQDRWRMVANLPAIVEDGRRRYPRTTKVVHARGLRRAEKVLAKWITDLEAHDCTDPTRITVAQLVRRWLEEAKWNVRPATLHFYERTTRLHVLPELGDVAAATIGPADLSRLYAAKRDAGLAESSVHHIHASVRACFRWALAEDLLDRNPADRVKRPPRQVREERHVWTQDTVARAAIAADGLVVGVPMVLAAWAGLRRGEVCGLRWENVDLDGGRLAIAEVLEQTKAGALHIEPPKTAHGERIVPLAPAVVEILRRHKARQDEYAVAHRRSWNAAGYVICRRDGAPMKPDNLSSAWSSFVRSHGLPQISFHDLRHTYATDLFAQAENPESMLKVVQELLGHAHASTTADIYLHATDGAAEIAMATHGDRVGEALRKAANNSHSSSTRVVSLAAQRRKKSSK